MKLSLCPKREFPEVILNLQEVCTLGSRNIRAEELYTQRFNGQVYSDIPYSAAVILEGSRMPTKVNVYINGKKINTFGQPGEDRYVLAFVAEQYPRGDVFRDCYGYIRIEIECYWETEREPISYMTNYIVVMLKATNINRAIQRMAEYVYKQHKNFLWKQNVLPLGNVHLTNHKEKSLDTLIAILKTIMRVYEHNVAFFRTNPHTKAEATFRVDDFARLQAITPQTLRYIAQHPNELIGADTDTGITYNKKSYLPVHTLITNKERIRETYENRAVLGFIHEVAMQSRNLIERIDLFLFVQPVESRSVNGYISSATYILQTTRHNLQAKREELAVLSDMLTEFYWVYKRILPVEDIAQAEIPMATDVFLSIAPYRQIYDVMMQWYIHGVYDMSAEDFLLPLLINNQMYEYYVLFKLAEALEANGYVLKADQCLRYQYAVGGDYYRDTDHTNTFVFCKTDDDTITLYFQPVVWGHNYSESNSNGIALRRSTSLSIDQNGSENRNVSRAYYTPDYILKHSNGTHEAYIIADAKLSTYETVKGIQIENLVYKYSFSIQTTSEKAKLLGVLIFYGKSVQRDCNIESVHDLYQATQAPDFWLTSLTESENALPNDQTITLTRIINMLALHNRL